MKIVNLTPHEIVLQDPAGQRLVVPPSGTVARVSQTPGQPSVVDGVPVPIYSPSTFGPVEGLPAHADDTLCIVSSLVLSRPEVQSRGDCVAPGTGPADGAIRVGDGPRKGQIEAVTRLVRG